MSKRIFKPGKNTFGIIFSGIILVGVFVFISPFLYAHMNSLVYWVVVIAVMAAVLGMCLLFYRTVYLPFLNLERRIQMLQVSDGDDVSDMFSDTDSVLERIDDLIKLKQNEMEREQARILMEEKMKYAELQNQINPHFLYNTLENIRGQAIIDDNMVIAEMTEALSKYFRYNISKDNDIVKLAQELENIETYVKIQQYRFNGRFDFRIINHDQTDVVFRCMIPKLTLQPIVENAIFHGMENKIQKGHIVVHVDLSGEHVAVIVADDGVGMDEETLTRLQEKLKTPPSAGRWKDSGSDGIAMSNINARLKLLYGPEYGLNVSSIKNVGTQVELILPLKTGKG
ncbi:two-component system sensor histidine kinase YesM [Catenibacillus scindens]|uniref:Two-component system sensor histidine kinase YesM n=1 Tax=Catenibacillus scindens TaxID=673271 RepID=A0A7W8M468_9FIRM|nr:two-component system sensor histidine kinase YesM [Catenibacillus scindens]